jgi:hypothetical protein
MYSNDSFSFFISLNYPIFPISAQQEEITRNERSWVKRCQVSAIFVTVAWVAWVLVIQVFLTDQFPSSWFVRESGSSDATGW